ncbi:DUF72 domain-containing protein [Streptomyces sp. NPDC008122]|uniref:DUF72 domain-containing protein n=1 Tax=Streptomyces sp. NPDC008122 TaxID=3364810 RepID=UPI0036ED656F
MTVFVGTSGWQYKDWRGTFYPQGVPQRLWLEEYARRFATVENNSAFYGLPERDTFATWRKRTPEGFVMAVKANRRLTHVERLREPEERVAQLMERAEGLGDRLGPVLLQFPPSLRADPGLLDAVLACFPAGVRVAVEPRHASWWTDRTEAVLVERGAALCWADRRSRPVTPLWRTADWCYLRLHEGRARPWPAYGRRALEGWAGRIVEGWPEGADAYVYFNNDPGVEAVRDAASFRRLMSGAGRTVAVPAEPAEGWETAGPGGRDSSHE